MENSSEINFKTKIIDLIKTKKAKIGIIGLGYVGLPLALIFSENGFNVIGLDIDLDKVKAINSGKSYIYHIPSQRLKDSRDKGLIEATNDFSEVSKLDAIIICVPTPLNTHREPDLGCVHSTMESITPYLKKGQIISLQSTTYPGTTEEEIKPYLVDIGLEVGENIFLIYSPEREDPGNENFETGTIPKLIGGITSRCTDIGYVLYSSVIKEVIKTSSTREAEMAKLLENIHRAVNIGLMNELKILCDHMDIDLFEVVRAASTKPFGFTPYYPGPGLGGHCIPIDPFFLTWKAREYNISTRFIELAGEINQSMPSYVVEKTTEALNNIYKSINGSKILILGVSYKKNVDDMRESPSITLINMFNLKGALVQYNDPFILKIQKLRKYSLNLKSIELNKEIISDFDAVILATDHDCYDYDLIGKYSKLLIDTRGRYDKSSKIIRA